MKAFTKIYAFSAILGLIVFLIGLATPSPWKHGVSLFGGMIAVCFSMMALAFWRMGKEDACGGKQESQRPDITATRQWVELMVNLKTANCLQVGGKAHTDLLATDEAARGWINLALNKVADLHAPRMIVMAFGYSHDSLWFEHHGIKYRAVVKVGLHDIPTENQPIPTPCSDEEFQAAWEEFDGFWQSHNSVGIKFEAVARCPEGVLPESQEIGRDCPESLVNAWKEHGMPEYKTLEGEDKFYCKYVCNGTLKLSFVGGISGYYKAY